MAGLLTGALFGPAQRLLAPAAAAPMLAQAAPQASGGLLSMFAPQAAQSPFYRGFDRNRDTITNMLLGGVGAETPLERMRGMAAGVVEGRKSDTSTKQSNQTAQWLSQQFGLSPEDAFVAVRNPDVMKFYLKSKGGVDAPASVEEWNHFNSLSPEDQSRYLRMKRATPWLNQGTQFAQPDPGDPTQVLGTMPIDNAGKAADTAAGKAQGEAAASYRSMASKLPGLQNVVNELDKIAEEATYTFTGQARDAVARQFGVTTEGALARTRYIAMVDNQILPLLRDTFGAQFTVAEGEALRATLGDPNKSPAEKQAVLKAFIEQKRRDVEALALQGMGDAAVSQPAAVPATPTAPQRLRFNPATGDFE